MKVGGDKYELENKKKPNIALANNEKKLNLYAKQSYHIQGLNQAEWGFWMSIVGAISGFIIIVVSLFIPKTMENSASLTLTAGSIIEIVSLLFFTISNKASERVSNSFDKLRLDSNIVNSIELAKSIENSDVKDEVKVKLSLYLAGVKEEHICNHIKTTCNFDSKNRSTKESDKAEKDVTSGGK
jgi:hypothetical protein